MLKYLKIGVASFALSAFAIAPAVIVFSADTAIAKNDNGKGGGNSGGKSGGNGNGKSKSDSKGKSSTGKSGGGFGKSKGGKTLSSGGSKSIKSFGNKLKSGFGIFGAPKKSKPSRNKSVAKTSTSTPKVKSFDHPSNLGKMNGAINSSPQAKLAHIKNGNFNGPVGIAAAYALADYDYTTGYADYDEAQTIIQALEPLAESFDYIAGYDDALDELARLDAEGVDPTSEEYLIAAASANAETYQSALDTIKEAEEAAIADGNSFSEELVYEQLAAASAIEEPDETTLEEAEGNLFALYKGDEDSLTDIEKELLIQSINLPTADQIEEINDGLEIGE